MSLNSERQRQEQEQYDCIHMYRMQDVEWVQNESWCHLVFGFMNQYSDPAWSWLQTCLVDLPVFWAFFLLDNPHDCFRCLGKDPDRIFSITQYTSYDLLLLKCEQKYGKKRTKNADLDNVRPNSLEIQMEIEYGTFRLTEA